jgi:hypothetical protein
VSDLDDYNFSALASPIAHPGWSALDPTGRVTFGLDDTGAAVGGQLWNGGGAVNTCIIGGCGTGTSNLLIGLLRATSDSPLVESVVIDAIGSHHGLGQADYVYGANHATGTLNALARTMHRRLGSDLPWSGPTDDEPLLLVVIPVLDDLLSSRGQVASRRDYGAAQMRESCITDLLDYGRKAGIGFAVDNPAPWIDRFGNSKAIRAAMFGGNLVLTRTDERSTTYSLPPGFAMDPIDLPRTFPNGGGLTAGLSLLRDHPRPFRSYLSATN